MIDLSSLLSPNHIVMPITADSRRALFDRLTEPLCADNIVTDKTAFLEALETREAQITTQIGARVAIPHARSPIVKRMGLTLGIVPEPGLPFDPEHDTPCRIFFLIAIPSFAPTAHLPLLKKLAQFAHDPKQVDKLLETNDSKKIIRQLATFKS